MDALNAELKRKRGVFDASKLRVEDVPAGFAAIGKTDYEAQWTWLVGLMKVGPVSSCSFRPCDHNLYENARMRECILT